MQHRITLSGNHSHPGHHAKPTSIWCRTWIYTMLTCSLLTPLCLFSSALTPVTTSPFCSQALAKLPSTFTRQSRRSSYPPPSWTTSSHSICCSYIIIYIPTTVTSLQRLTPTTLAVEFAADTSTQAARTQTSPQRQSKHETLIEIECQDIPSLHSEPLFFNYNDNESLPASPNVGPPPPFIHEPDTWSSTKSFG